MAKQIFVLAVLALFLLAPVAAAIDAEQPKTTPDKPFYGLSVALDKLSLAMTFDRNAKAKKALAHARERLLEIQAMKGNPDKAEISARNYADALEVAAQNIEKATAVNADAESDQLAENEKQLTSLVEKANEVSGELASDRTADQAKINSINEKIAKHREAIQRLEGKKAKLMDKLSDVKKVKVKEHDLEKETKAMEEIAKAETAIAVADASENIIMVANKHLTNAKTALAAKKFGEAYGQANAAYRLATAAHKINDKEAKENKTDAGEGTAKNNFKGQKAD